jgi:hypothetical protein
MIIAKKTLRTDTGFEFSLLIDRAPTEVPERLVVDIYPLHCPEHPKRHYGYFEIPLPGLKGGKNLLDLNLDFKKKLCRANNKKILPAWKSDFLESGEYLIHFNIFAADQLLGVCRTLTGVSHKVLIYADNI